MRILSLPELPQSMPELVENLLKLQMRDIPLTWLKRSVAVANCVPNGYGFPLDSEPLVAQLGDVALTHPAVLTLTVVPVESDQSFIGYLGQSEFQLRLKQIGNAANGYVTEWESYERGFVDLGRVADIDLSKPLWKLTHATDGARLIQNVGRSADNTRRTWTAGTWDVYGSNVLNSVSGDNDIAVSTVPWRVPDSERQRRLAAIDIGIMTHAGVSIDKLGLSEPGSFEGIVV